MPNISLASKYTFPAVSGSTILDAATIAGRSLPYSCKSGRCSSCKCKVLSGSTIALHAESGLSELEKSEGWVLACVRSAETDIVLDIEDLGDVVLPTAKTVPCRISHIENMASDVVKLLLRLPPKISFDYIPGQYIDVIGPEGVRRSYSLANALTAENNLLELHIRSVEGGAMSQYWFNQAKANDLLRLHGPLGTFFLRDSSMKDVFMLATGTGIAPIKAILESLTVLPDNQQPRSITVLWGAREAQNLYFDLKSIPGSFRYIPVLSRPTTGWGGEKGYVQDAMLKLSPNLKESVVYACGSNAMIHSAEKLLVANGLVKQNFYSDAFVCSGSV